jgi:hypothetical protein
VRRRLRTFDEHARHSSAARRFDSQGAVLEHKAVLGRNPHAFSRQQEHVGLRLAAANVGGGHDDAKQVLKTDHGQCPLHVF